MKRILVITILLAVVTIGKAGRAWACGGSLAASLGFSNSPQCPVVDLGPPDDIYYVPPDAGPSYSQPGWVGIPQWLVNGSWTGTPGICKYVWYNAPVDHLHHPGPNGYSTYNPNAANDYHLGYGAAPGGVNCNVPMEHLYIWQNEINGLKYVQSW